MLRDQSEPREVSSLDTLDAHRSLVERVMTGSGLSRAPRLRQLLQYISEKSLENPASQPSEEQIGVEVFGRRRGYDTATDTIVRVEVSKLRKKLEHYFLSEGAAEPIVLELPKRSYGLLFHVREQAPVVVPEAVETQVWWRSRRVWFSAAAILFISILVWRVAARGGVANRDAGQAAATPYRNHFWSHIFQSGRQTQLVTSDAMAMMLCDFLRRPLSVSEYIDGGYPTKLIDAEIRDPSIRATLKSEMSNYLTSMPDLRAATRISQAATAWGAQLNIIFARDFRYQPQSRDNLILLSHRKANPWASLFDRRLNFRYEFHSPSDLEQTAEILNLAPQAGEQARYRVEWGAQTYSVIAYQRKPVGEGAVLMIMGGDVGSVEAGCDLLSDEGRLRGVYERLNIRPTGPLPDFEILLRAKLLRASVLEYDLVAHRLLPPAAGPPRAR